MDNKKIQTTKEFVNEAQCTIEKKRHCLSSMAVVIVALGGDNDDGYYTHDNNLALDVESLRDAEVVFTLPIV